MKHEGQTGLKVDETTDVRMIRSVDGRRSITVEEFDRMFDDGEDISDFIDRSRLTRPALVPKRVNVDFPTWMVNRLDAEAARLGITRQAVIKTWIGERLGAGQSS
jgi:hypothetical protein